MVKWLISTFIGLSLLDGYLTTRMVQSGGTELNPIMRWIIEQSFTYYWLTKIVVSIIIMVLIFLVIAKYYPLLGKVMALACTLVALVAVIWNLVQIILAGGI